MVMVAAHQRVGDQGGVNSVAAYPLRPVTSGSTGSGPGPNYEIDVMGQQRALPAFSMTHGLV
jgi:hypothetical protein